MKTVQKALCILQAPNQKVKYYNRLGPAYDLAHQVQRTYTASGKIEDNASPNQAPYNTSLVEPSEQASRDVSAKMIIGVPQLMIWPIRCKKPI